MRYGFLEGRQFQLKGDFFTVKHVTELDGRCIVRAVPETGGANDPRTFPVDGVLAHLVVEEEIELSAPAY